MSKLSWLGASKQNFFQSKSKRFDKRMIDIPQFDMVDQVWLRIRKISTTRPSSKTDHQWLEPFAISQQVFTSSYRETLHLSMKGFQPVFNVYILHNHKTDFISERQRPVPEHVELNHKEGYEVGRMLNFKRSHIQQVQDLPNW